jgi:hypothetical protein
MHELGERLDRKGPARADRRTSEMNIELRPLKESEEEIFVRENQIAFDKAAIEEFCSRRPESFCRCRIWTAG